MRFAGAVQSQARRREHRRSIMQSENARGEDGRSVPIPAGASSRQCRSWCDPPRRHVFPLSQFVECPRIGFLTMAGSTRNWNAVLFGQCWGYEFKSMASNVCCTHRPCNLRHVTGDTLAAFRIYGMSSMVRDRLCWSWLELRLMTCETQVSSGHDEVSLEFCAVSVMAT